MNVGNACTRDVVTCLAHTSLAEVATRMRDRHVGAVVVLDDEQRRRPIGVVTDRDIVIEIVATGLDANAITAGDVMLDGLVTVDIDSDPLEAARSMRSRGVRRLPVVDRNGALAGIVTLDDLVHLLSTEMGYLARLIERQPKREAQLRP
ncbi:MAG: CBS domain-containing protein [Burkholderiales bacterium]|nr:MAG: CBS domain-containing protein [Burkholderiales bacterium]